MESKVSASFEGSRMGTVLYRRRRWLYRQPLHGSVAAEIPGSPRLRYMTTSPRDEDGTMSIISAIRACVSCAAMWAILPH